LGLTLKEGAFIVKFARKSIEEYLREGKKTPIPMDAPETLMEKRGVFVTLNSVASGRKVLRGCIGYPEPVMPLIKAVRESAISAAVMDPRFNPVTHRELSHIMVEVSVLTIPELVNVDDPREYAKKVEVGRHGLIVEKDWYRGLLLPQVPLEYGWDSEEFLSNTCIKAGLVPDAWLLPDTKVYTFEAIVFAEKTPAGEVCKVELSRCE
jgi:hypothetical protein